MKILKITPKLVATISFKALHSFCLVSILLFSCALTAPLTSAAEVQNKVSNDDNYKKLVQQIIIRRTDYGVPHIYADNIEAAGFALGYVQLEDNGTKVVEGLLMARGEWTKYHELDGEELKRAIDSDAASKQNYVRAVETWHLLETETREIMEGFAQGLNYYIQLHPEEFEDWVQPFFTVYEIHAVGLKGPSENSIKKFLNALANTTAELNVSQKPEMETPGTVWSRLAAVAEGEHPDVGSNAWAFAPSRTTSGNAILVRNPHLSWSAGYYEAHVKVPGKLNFYGDFRIGAPLGIIGGFNERLGWATTNNSPKLDEIYALKKDPNQPGNYLLDDASLPIKKEIVTVEFKKNKNLLSETREFLSTPFGPVIHQEDGYIYIIKSSNEGVFRAGEQFFRMMKAQNIDAWKSAMQMRARTSSNLTYADADGNIFYVWNASIPVLPQRSGDDTLAIHVSKTKQMWTNVVSWEDLPKLENPEGGYLRNENDPFYFTNLNEILDPANYPDNFPEPQLRLRSQYSLSLIDNDQKYSLEEIVALKHSMGMYLADRVKPDLITAVRKTELTDEVAQAIQLMEEWDNTVARESRGGVLFETWWDRYVDLLNPDHSIDPTPQSAGFSATADDLFAEPWSVDKPVETPTGLGNFELAADAFEWAVSHTKDRYGAWDISWGDVHRARIGNKDFAVGGCAGLLGCFRVLSFDKDPLDEQKLVVEGGDGWILAVEFDDVPKAYSVLAYGESENEESPFYNDQLELFTNNEMKRVVFTDEDVMKQLKREYRPGQEK